MKKLFSHKRRMSLVTGGITLLTVSIMVSIFTTSPLETQTYAQKSWKQPPLGTTKTAFSDFCYSYWTAGHRSQGLDCLKQSKNALQLLQHEMSPDSFAKWPQQASLSDLAAQNLLLNPQNMATIKTQQDFIAAIPPADGNVRTLFNGDQGNKMLAALWTYKLTSTNATPTPPPVPASNQPPSCPVNSQSFLHSEVWSVAGPMLLTSTDQALQDQNNQHLGIYDIYGRLLLQDHCSIAALASTMKLNGQSSPQPKDVSDWERTTLLTTALNNTSNNQLFMGLISMYLETDNTLVDSWFSGAVITRPTSSLVTSTATPTNGSSAPPNGVYVN